MAVSLEIVLFIVMAERKFVCAHILGVIMKTRKKGVKKNMEWIQNHYRSIFLLLEIYGLRCMHYILVFLS